MLSFQLKWEGLVHVQGHDRGVGEDAVVVATAEVEAVAEVHHQTNTG